MMRRFSRFWKALLLAVPMLMCSLKGQAYWIEFGAPYATSSTEGQIINSNKYVTWTYVINGFVGSLSYSADKNALSFSLNGYSEPRNSLMLTSSQRFSGKLNGISILCSEIPGLAITAYVGQTELGDLIWTGKGYANSSSFSRGLLYERISLKFKVASGANGVNASGLSTVHLSLQEKVFPLYIGSSVTFDSSLSGVDLSNHTYEGKGILFTLDSSKGDGCVDEDGNGVIYIGSTLSDIAVSNLDEKVRNHVTNHWPGDPGYAEDFAGGITVMAARGKGIIGLEAMTESNYAYHVKIGDAAPVEVASTTRRWLEVPYNVNRDTYIYIYLVDKSAAARANNDSGRSGTRIGKRETAHGIVFSLRCASAPVEVSDISVYVDYIMGRDTFIFHNADVNNDYRINVADIVKILKSK
jgi:hypothetical protein